MKLLYTPNSPYARKVRIVALEKHIDLTLQEVVLVDANCPVSNHNPLGKVPVLILDDNDSLYDSTVIVEYLDNLSDKSSDKLANNRATGARLIAQDNSSKINIRRWEALCDGICDAAIVAMLEGSRSLEQQSRATIDRQLEKVTRALAVLNADITKKKWCVNETFSLADIALGCMLGYVDLRFKILPPNAQPWQNTFPNLAKHYSVLIKRPSFKQTMPVL